MRAKATRGVVLVFALSLLYAFLARVMFTLPALKGQLEIVSLSFLVLVPMAFGALATYLGICLCGRHWFWIWIAPILVSLIGFAGSFWAHLEALFCVVVAAPVMLPCAVLGGAIIGLVMARGKGRLPMMTMLLLPFAISPLEQTWKQEPEFVSIHDAIDIAAPPERVWKEIASVPRIDRGELPQQVIYWLGFPRPISATLSGEGVGSRRMAVFERGVSFFETVTDWQPFHRLAFTIMADPQFIPHTAFDRHIVVGGRFYNVLDGRYEIEEHAGGCRLHLTSTHVLGTPFNAYSSWWSRWVMNQIQGSILEVIRNRAERG